MATPPELPDLALERYRAYLECLTYIQVDPRLWRRFGWSDIVNHTLLEAHRERHVLEALEEADRNRRLRRMLMNNLLERIEHERAQARDYRREVPMDEALTGTSVNLQRWLADDAPGPDGQAQAREREALILQKYHGWTQAQIAERLGCTAGAVAGLHARGLKRLRELLPDLSEEE